MRNFAFSVVLASALLSACDSGETDSSGQSATSALTTLPATIEGTLTVDVAEGDVDGEGTSELNFGTLTVGGEEIMVQVSGSLLSGAGIPETGSKVRATLGSKSDEFGATMYTVTALHRL